MQHHSSEVIIQMIVSSFSKMIGKDRTSDFEQTCALIHSFHILCDVETLSLAMAGLSLKNARAKPLMPNFTLYYNRVSWTSGSKWSTRIYWFHWNVRQTRSPRSHWSYRSNWCDWWYWNNWNQRFKRTAR